MAIQPAESDHRHRLARALRRSYNDGYKERQIRRNLIGIYEDLSDYVDYYDADSDATDLGTLLNLFQKYVKGHLLSLAHYAPRWAINARTREGRGFDKRIQNFLTRYSEILNFHVVQQQLALDSAFGWAVCKIDNGLPPKGITAPVAPRMYRIDPNTLIIDRSAATFDECSYIGDMYLVPLNEAQNYEWSSEGAASRITEYRYSSSSGSSTLEGNVNDESFAEPMARLVDIYIPKQGKIYTWNCPNDEFREINDEPLGERASPINPYSVLSLLNKPGQIVQISRLASLRGLHLLANEMLNKGVNQARASQRNPVAPMGSEQELEAALDAGDNNPVYINKEELGMFSIPGPDSSILNLATAAAGMFSQEAGNLEVALGSSTGADTARQTEALLGQISASQSIDRRTFEMFLAEIGQKLATLAFQSETLELTTMTKIPGTKYQVNQLWGTPEMMPRVAEIDSFHFDVAQYSTSFRTPQERLGQLQQASQLVMTWMQAAAQGAPIKIEQVIADAEEAFDLVPNLTEWWSGQPPTPAEKTQEAYTSLAQSPEGSDVRYHGAGGGDEGFQDSEPQGGVE